MRNMVWTLSLSREKSRQRANEVSNLNKIKRHNLMRKQDGTATDKKMDEVSG